MIWRVFVFWKRILVIYGGVDGVGRGSFRGIYANGVFRFFGLFVFRFQVFLVCIFLFFNIWNFFLGIMGVVGCRYRRLFLILKMFIVIVFFQGLGMFVCFIFSFKILRVGRAFDYYDEFFRNWIQRLRGSGFYQLGQVQFFKNGILGYVGGGNYGYGLELGCYLFLYRL